MQNHFNPHPNNRGRKQIEIMKKYNVGDKVILKSNGMLGAVIKVRKHGYIYYRYTVDFYNGKPTLHQENDLTKPPSKLQSNEQ